MSRHTSIRCAALVAALLLAAPPVAAQVVRTPEARLAGRLDDETRRLVLAQVDSADQAGLPVDPLVARALEGSAKRGRGSAIVGAVRELRGLLATSRQLLGRSATAPELGAGAAALQARVQPSVLAALRRARPAGPLTVPLSVLTDLVSLGVPADTAARTVLALARVEDAALVAFQRDVERDIGIGALPSVAASVRAAGLERAAADGYSSPVSAGSPGSPGTPGAPTRPPTPRKP